MKKKPKIGIIQNAPLTADFSNNLRSIVQSYRDCIDRGAELIIAPAFALCGPDALDFCQRRSFIEQSEHALNLLSLELGSVPLILASYSNSLSQMSDQDIFGLEEIDEEDLLNEVYLSPFLLENNEITQLDETIAFELGGINIYVEIGSEESYTDIDELDLMIRLSGEAWYAGHTAQEQASRSWEAQTNKCSLACIYHVGMSEGQIYGGGSSFYNASGEVLARLPFFESAQVVVDLQQAATARALPTEESLLRHAIVRALRDSCRNHGYQGITLSTQSANSQLLALLAQEAVGASNLKIISFGGSVPAWTKEIGVTCQQIELGELPSQLLERAELQEDQLLDLHARMQANLLVTIAKQEGKMLISALSRRELMLGDFALYAQCAAQLLPLGSLYEMDIYLLSKHMDEERPGFFGSLTLPSRSEIDSILHETLDRNVSPSELLQEHGDSYVENDVRLIQRRCIASAAKRAQLPPILLLDKPEERHRYPICHRLND